MNAETTRQQELTVFEREARKAGFKCIAGVDEAGRGPLAGPVVAAVCVIEAGCYFPGIDDSKRLTQKMRKSLYEELVCHSQVLFGVGIVDHKQIDELNILQASLLAMRLAVEQLASQPDYCLVDGRDSFCDHIATKTLIRGDALCQSIMAASIIAKERRDALMVHYHGLYPEYGFDQHKGYPTKTHRETLKVYGPSPIHRKSFKWY